MTIRAARAEEAGAVIGLWYLCGLTRPWNDPAQDFARALEGDASTILVAEGEGGGLLGSAMVGDDGHRGWVYYLAVAPAARRIGLGRALMTAAEEWLRARGCPKVQLMVREDNAEALGFYAALGLEREGVVTLGRFLGD
ncbi:GNAT family acetyltransferase [Sphingomonas kyeonggiensis]|uniref:Ribosomal protein S18 acetylase RimI-like enzyme n=1 Tax=Sphingomonas kyeonggiensis TaxID=1268553 RepID=A0A7W6JQN4_9SPHN|nr:GNAT family acetyltransferase [Sphingomonas kyeonggiensis]MBB4096736.1 ribosomal protein S18 acetylase RimI-like enzyme [Sphingomonas kyeonggiensis]